MISRFNKLKDAWLEARSEEDRENIEKQLDTLKAENPKLFSDAVAEDLENLQGFMVSIQMREALKEVLPYLSMAEINRRYFKKTTGWMSQRLNGLKVNDKIAYFSKGDVLLLQQALKDLSQKLASVDFTDVLDLY